MSEEQNETAENEEEPQQTLEDIAKEFNVEGKTEEFTAQPKQEPVAQPAIQPSIPDPVYDPDQYQAYQAQLLNQNAQISEGMKALSEQLGTIQAKAEQEAIDKDVQKAVSQVNEKLNIDPLYAEILLEKKYRDDPIFKRIWDNRNNNPKALSAALNVVANESAGAFQARQDPQLTENHRAAKASQQTLATGTKGKSKSEEMMSLSDAEFDAQWESMIGG